MGVVAQSVERATSGQGGMDSILDPGARVQLVLAVPVYCDRLRQKPWYPRFVYVWQHVKFSNVSSGSRRRDSLVADEDVKKPTNQRTVQSPQ